MLTHIAEQQRNGKWQVVRVSPNGDRFVWALNWTEPEARQIAAHENATRAALARCQEDGDA